MRNKAKRHSGRYYPRPTNIRSEDNYYIVEEYDDWDDWRDGFRDIYSDGKLLKKIPDNYLTSKRKHLNKKIKKMIKRRKERKHSNRYK